MYIPAILSAVVLASAAVSPEQTVESPGKCNGSKKPSAARRQGTVQRSKPASQPAPACSLVGASKPPSSASAPIHSDPNLPTVTLGDHAGLLRGLNRAKTTAEEISLVKSYVGSYDGRPHGTQLDLARSAARLALKPVTALPKTYSRSGPTVAGYVAGMPTPAVRHADDLRARQNTRYDELRQAALSKDMVAGATALQELLHVRRVIGAPNMSLGDQHALLSECGWPDEEIIKLFVWLAKST
jgi:hypothetical protein